MARPLPTIIVPLSSHPGKSKRTEKGLERLRLWGERNQCCFRRTLPFSFMIFPYSMWVAHVTPGIFSFSLLKKKFREGGLGWGTHVNPWLIHVNVWQKPLQYCKVISLQLIKINEKKFIYFALPDLL